MEELFSRDASSSAVERVRYANLSKLLTKPAEVDLSQRAAQGLTNLVLEMRFDAAATKRNMTSSNLFVSFPQT